MSRSESFYCEVKALLRATLGALLLFIISSVFASAASGQAALPKGDTSESFDVEPPLLIEAVTPTQTPVTVELDLERLAAAVERAKKTAAAGANFYRAGVISKVEMEQRALKVVRLESDLSNGQFERAKQDLAAKQIAFNEGNASSEELSRASEMARLAEKAAKTGMARREQAEVDAAKLNLQRQQKLLAAGSARSSDVHRAEEKLAALTAQKD
ncbi:MAG: hypothetical protein ACR2MF_11250 [Chthoniobacterales bacterium]